MKKLLGIALAAFLVVGIAGQAAAGIALMLIGPAVAWALLPMLFSPFTNTVLSQWGWPVLLVWLPVSALISSAALALYLRRRFPRPKIENAEQSRIHIPRGLMVGVAAILVVLFSIPLAPLVGGIPNGQAQQKMMADLPDRAAGAYLSLSDGQQAGNLKLFPWSFPVEDFPDESPVVNPAQVRSLTIRQKGLAEPESYLLYHFEDEDFHPVPLKTQVLEFQRELMLTPAEPLETGTYMLDIPTGGMFAGREYYYFTVDPAVTALPPLATAETKTSRPEPGGGSSPIWLEILPLSAAVISGWMALVMLRRMRQKVRPQEAAWAVAFAMFAVAASMQVVGDVIGWTPAMARIYYICGATLVVGWLGLGTWLILVHRPWLRNLGTWGMILLTGVAIGLVSQAPVQLTALAETGWHALEKPALLTILTIGLNTVGTLVLVGGALWSAWVFWRKGIMKGRMVGLIFIAVGALTVAAGGSLTRLGHEQFLYAAMSVGVGLMFWGYLKTIQPTPATDSGSPSAHVAQVATAAEVHAGV